MPIEATILAYKALSADAVAIAGAVNGKLTVDKSVLVIGTSGDVAAIVQLRIILGQCSILQHRLETLSSTFTSLSALPAYSVTPFQPQASAGSPFIASPSDVATLIQTIGSITAVNESLTSASGSLNDNTLISLIAGNVKAKSMIFPSQMPPNLLTSKDIHDTYIGTALADLEKAREDAVDKSLKYSQALVDGKTILAAKPGVYSDSDVKKAGEIAEKAAQIGSLTDLISKASTAVDSFESSLLTGQAPAPSNSAPSNPNTPGGSPGTGLPAGPGSGLPSPNLPSSPPAPNPPTPNPPTTNPPQTQTPPTQNQTAQQQSSPTSGGVLQQVLYADLLLHSLLVTAGQLDNVNLLAVHALESGGGQLSKSNLFLGSRIYFSGGAVASFTLYDSNSNLRCSGVGYGYRGYIREKDMEGAVKDTNTAATVVTNCK